MNCPLETSKTEMLLDYSAGRLDGLRKAALELHMERCAKCAAFCIEQQAVWDALDVWEPEPVSQDFNRRLWQRIDRAAQTPWHSRLLDPLRHANWRPAIPITAAILTIAGGFLLDHPGRTKAVPGTTVNGVSVSEADQVEQSLDDVQLLRQLDQLSVSARPM